MTGQLIDTFVSVTLLLLVVLVLRGPVARQFGARAAYALWLAPLARLVAPLVAPLVPAGETTGGTGSGTMPEIVIVRLPATSGFDWLPWLAGLWAVGAGVYLAIQLIRHQLFIREALSNGSMMSLPGVPFDVVASEAVDGPMATGLIHPMILVPADFATRFTSEQQRLALLHEQLHHRRGDI